MMRWWMLDNCGGCVEIYAFVSVHNCTIRSEGRNEGAEKQAW